MNESIIKCLEEWTEIHPDQHIFTFTNYRDDVIGSYNYSDFRARVRRFAYVIKQELSLPLGARVIIVYPPGLEHTCSLLACIQLGLIPVPVCAPRRGDNHSLYKRLESISSSCSASAALSTSAYWETFPKEYLKAVRKLGLDADTSLSDEYIGIHHHDIAFLQYTSGSTGSPKGVVVSHSNIIHNCHATLDHVPIGVCWLPQYHDMGLIGHYLFPIVKGGQNYGLSPSDFLRKPYLWLKKITDVAATITASPNFGYQYCAEHKSLVELEEGSLDLSSLKIMLNAAEPVKARTMQAFYNKFKRFGLQRNILVAGYGLAENTITVSMHGTRYLEYKDQNKVTSRCDYQNDKITKSLDTIMSCGRPVEGVDVRIVDPKSLSIVKNGCVGEIWISGPSTCAGYWSKTIANTAELGDLSSSAESASDGYHRTGDLGFLYDGELYITGRIKDVIIINGVNYHPSDLEDVVIRILREHYNARRVTCAAFSVNTDDNESVAVLIEDAGKELNVSLDLIVRELRVAFAINKIVVYSVKKGTIRRTTSGKIARLETKDEWCNDGYRALARSTEEARQEMSTLNIVDRLELVLSRFESHNHDELTLGQSGLDSIELVELVAEMQDTFTHIGKVGAIPPIDIGFVQDQRIVDLIDFFRLLESGSDRVQGSLLTTLHNESDSYAEREKRMMSDDRSLGITLHKNQAPFVCGQERLFMTGCTGFLGVHILRDLLLDTNFRIKALVRCRTPNDGHERILKELEKNHLLTEPIRELLSERVDIICGDLSREQFGITSAEWDKLSKWTDVVLHNGAKVNYISSYSNMRPANVNGTRTALELASHNSIKPFYYVSTTFIFGWLSRGVLYEHAFNHEMIGLDFGYSQSKWVGEDLVRAAARNGMPAHIFRPSLVSPSLIGGGSKTDIAIRLLSYMINYGKGLSSLNQISLLPVDIVSKDIVHAINTELHSRSAFIYSHMTLDEYYNFKDITKSIESLHGLGFQYSQLEQFVDEMNLTCTASDLLYPLVPFFTRAQVYISKMEAKRYDNTNYRSWRREKRQPSIEQIVKSLSAYMINNHLVRKDKISATHLSADKSEMD